MDHNKFDKIVKAKAEEGFEAFDMEAMWSKVEPQLPKERKRRFIPWWIMGLVILVLSGYLVSEYLDPTTAAIENLVASDDVQVDKHHTPLDAEQETSMATITSATLKKDVDPSKDAQNEVKIHHELKPPMESVPSTTNEIAPMEKVINETKDLSFGNGSDQETADRDISNSAVMMTSVKKEDSSILDEKSASFTESDYREGEALLDETIVAEESSLLELELQNLNPLGVTLDLNADLFVLLEKPTAYQRVQKEEAKNPSYLEFGIGYFLNNRKMSYTGLDQSILERVATEKGLDAQSAYLNYYLPLNKSWMISMGIEYQSIWDSRNHQYQQTSDSIYLTDVVIGREVSKNGVSETIGDVTVGSKRRYDINAYVNYKSIGLPLGLSYQTNTNKRIDWSFGLGITPSIVISRSGQIYHKEREYDVASDLESIYSNSIKVDAFASTGLIYHWNKQWSTTFNIRGELPLTTLYNNNYNLIDKHYLLGAQLGVRYRID